MSDANTTIDIQGVGEVAVDDVEYGECVDILPTVTVSVETEDETDGEPVIVVSSDGAGSKGIVAEGARDHIIALGESDYYIACRVCDGTVAVSATDTDATAALSGLLASQGALPEFTPPANPGDVGVAGDGAIPRKLDRTLAESEADEVLDVLDKAPERFAVTFPVAEGSETYIRGVPGEAPGGGDDNGALFVGVRKGAGDREWAEREYTHAAARRMLVRAAAVRIVPRGETPDSLYP